MINAIGEATVQQAIRANHNNLINDREVITQKTEQIREDRPVEKSDDSWRADDNMAQNDKTGTTSQHRIEEGEIILERYDKNGKLIAKIPPGYVPFGEIA